MIYLTRIFYKELPIRVIEPLGYVCASDLLKHTPHRSWHEFLKDGSNERFCEILAGETQMAVFDISYCLSKDPVIESVIWRSKGPEWVGLWLHPDIAERLAIWIGEVKFAQIIKLREVNHAS